MQNCLNESDYKCSCARMPFVPLRAKQYEADFIASKNEKYLH